MDLKTAACQRKFADLLTKYTRNASATPDDWKMVDNLVTECSYSPKAARDKYQLYEHREDTRLELAAFFTAPALRAKYPAITDAYHLVLAPYIEQTIDPQVANSGRADNEITRLLTLNNLCLATARGLQAAYDACERVLLTANRRINDDYIYERSWRAITRVLDDINTQAAMWRKLCASGFFFGGRPLYDIRRLPRVSNVLYNREGAREVWAREGANWRTEFILAVCDIRDCLYSEYGSSQFETIMEQCFPSKSILEPAYLLTYDIKDSSGEDDPQNRDRAEDLKGLLNRELDDFQRKYDDGLFNYEFDDKKFVALEST